MTQTLHEQQLSRETYLFSMASSNKRANLQRTIDDGYEHLLKYGKEAFLMMVDPVGQYLEGRVLNNQFAQNKFLKDILRPAYERWLVETETLNKSQRKWDKNPAYKMAELISLILASDLSNEERMSKVVTSTSRSIFQLFEVEFSEREELTTNLASLLIATIEVASASTGIFHIEQRNGRENVLYVAEPWVEYIAKCQDEIDTNADAYAPMIVPPIKHTNLISSTGGYLTMKSPLLKKPFKDKVIHQSILNFNSENNPEFFDMVNRIQETPFCVNRNMFEAVSYYYSLGYFFKENPFEEDQYRDRYAASAFEEVEIREKRRKSYAEYAGIEFVGLTNETKTEILNRHLSKGRNEVFKTKRLFEHCEDFGQFDAIYFPIFFDFRNRRYPYSSYGLTYMGDELSKSLICFGNKEKFTLTGIKNLFSNLGNALGHDKLDYKRKRVIAFNWFNENKVNLVNKDYRIFFDKQDEFDEPINAMAICIELCEWLKDSEYKSGYMAHRDARCSGSSIIGSVMGDELAMTLTSVLEKESSERLPDAYMSVAEMALNKAIKLNSQNLLEHQDILFSRKAFKKPVMTKGSYGLTDYSVRQGNKTLFQENELDDVLENSDLTLYNRLMLDSLAESLPSCFEYLNSIKKVSEVPIYENDGLVSYLTPVIGFPVVYKVFKEQVYKVETRVNGKKLSLKLIISSDKVDTVGTKTSMAPNIIHSLDGTVLNLVNIDVGDKFDIATIHDSIASHPNHSDSVRRSYNSAIVTINKSDCFNDIANQLGSDVTFSTNIINPELIINSKHSLV